MHTIAKNKTLVVITGPTATGKTAVSISLAKALNTSIVSADSRQFYREMQIGTAVPEQALRRQVPHHFIGHLSIHDYYNVSLFEQQALGLLDKLFMDKDYVVLTGGSGLYIDTLCEGIDELPDHHPVIRKRVLQTYRDNGLDGLRTWLKAVDPVHYEQADTDNPNRLMRAIEVFLVTGQPYSSLRKKACKERPFRIKKIVLDRPREELFNRINKRTTLMVHQGLVEEALQLFPFRHLNALNTVGYKELFAWLAGGWPLAEAVEKIRTHTRRYAKRQLTWFKRYDNARWIHPDQEEEMLDFILNDN